MKRKFLGIMLFVLCMGFVLVGCAEKVDVEELYDIEARGANGYGSIELVINESYANQVMNDEMNALSDRLKSEYRREGLHTFPPYQYINTLDYEIIDGDDGNLSNGDEITIQISENENLADEANMKLSTKEIKYTVEGLREPRKIDVFKGVSFSFDGDDGEGTGYFSSDSGELPIDVEYKIQVEDESDYYYEIYNLSNGQKIQVMAEFDEQAALENGYIIEEKTKEFTVEGLKEYEIVDLDTLIAGMSYTIEGASPNVSIEVENNLPDDLYGYFSYYVEPSYGIKIGDTIEITISADQYALKEKGKSFPDGQATVPFEIREEDVPQYLSDISQLTEDDITFLKKEADDRMTAILADFKNSEYKWYEIGDVEGNADSIGAPQLAKTFLMYPKESTIQNVSRDYSYLGFVYTIDMVVDEQSVKGYYILSFQNLQVNTGSGLDRTDFDVAGIYNITDEESAYSEFVDHLRDMYSYTELSTDLK